VHALTLFFYYKDFSFLHRRANVYLRNIIKIIVMATYSFIQSLVRSFANGFSVQQLFLGVRRDI